MPDGHSIKGNSGCWSEDRLSELGERFGFDSAAPELRQELNYIARRYRRDLIAFDGVAVREAERVKYKKLLAQIDALQETLASPEYDALGSEIYLTLRTEVSDNKAGVIRMSTIPNAAVGDHILNGLDDMLKLISNAARNVEERNAPAKGRKPDYALEALVRNIAYLWSDILKRPFTLDYHKGSALTEAANFVKAIIGYLGPDIPETRLITTMRTIISERNFVSPTK